MGESWRARTPEPKGSVQARTVGITAIATSYEANASEEEVKMKTVLLTCVLVLLALFSMRPGTAQEKKAPMSFFVTSEGPGNRPITTA